MLVEAFLAQADREDKQRWSLPFSPDEAIMAITQCDKVCFRDTETLRNVSDPLEDPLASINNGETAVACCSSDWSIMLTVGGQRRGDPVIMRL
jgi:hypothetical protein